MSKEHFFRPGEAMCDTPIEYRACGLDGIFLCNGYEKDEIDGDEYIHIKDIEGLHKAIACHLVEHRKALSPKEIRFIRVAMDKTQGEIGRVLGVTSQSVARWEKGQSEMPGPADRMLRLIFLASLLSAKDFAKYFSELPESLDEMDESRNEPMQFRRDKHDKEWREAA